MQPKKRTVIRDLSNTPRPGSQASAGSTSCQSEDPEEITEQLMDGLRRLLGSAVGFRTQVSHGGSDIVYSTEAVLPKDLTRDQLDQAKALVDSAMEPASDVEFGDAYLRVERLTLSRAENNDDAGARFIAYRDKARGYPRDIMLQAMDEATDCKYFPAWAEIKRRCEELIGPRRRLRNAINKARHGGRSARNRRMPGARPRSGKRPFPHPRPRRKDGSDWTNTDVALLAKHWDCTLVDAWKILMEMTEAELAEKMPLLRKLRSEAAGRAS